MRCDIILTDRYEYMINNVIQATILKGTFVFYPHFILQAMLSMPHRNTLLGNSFWNIKDGYRRKKIHSMKPAKARKPIHTCSGLEANIIGMWS
jgi:hypothetical protein